ncbi:hypothetical protein SKAU_G00232080 [Synaphobranchus kaupii]|uniref:Uncharacterized protein n=1 Tax=Synaphobranchus kaupii TaxID=118154 RepID=A0A9Q1IT29_SYNKA|nr:hypothetical protein SKAU_G00232080 [Synaphobranchus kaupii]
MSSCCVVGCHNRSSKIKGINFYRIPSGKRPFNANRRRLWLQAIKRVDWNEDIIRNARICGAHFISGEASMNYESPDFVPSVFEYSKPSQRPEVKLKRFQRRKQRAEERSVKSPSPLTEEKCRTDPCPALVKDHHHETKTMDFKWMTVTAATSGGHLQCAFCRYQCKSNATFQMHIGTSHPFHCEEMDVGRLGKIIFYQRSAKLFHCQECFFTGKTYSRVYDHVLVSHSFSRKDKCSGNGDPKDYLSDSNDSKDIPDNDNNDEERPEGGDGEGKPMEVAYLQAPAKFVPLNCVKNEEEELYDEDSRHSGSPSQPPKRKREQASDEEAPLDSEDFPDYSGKPERDTDEAQEEKQAEETLLSKYIRRTGGRFYCNICNWRGKMKGFMFHHVSKKHNIPRPFACKECNKSFLLESMLHTHVSMFHKQGIYQCPYCSFKSNYLRGVRRHLNNCNAKQGEGSYDSDEQD